MSEEKHMPIVPEPRGKTRAEFIAEVMSDGVTNLGTAMTLADAAGKLHGYTFSHEQVYAITRALAAARLALADSSNAAHLIRADALSWVNRACDLISNEES